MMRTIAVAQSPDTPTVVSAVDTGVNTPVTVSWTDNSIISNWVTIQQSLDGITNADGSFKTVNATFNVLEPECTVQTGCARSYVDTTIPVGTPAYYRVMANNTVGAGDNKAALPASVSQLTPGLGGYDNVTSESLWSGVVSRLVVPTASVTAGPLAFGNQSINPYLTPPLQILLKPS
jgi:hypothetical protein